MLVVGDHDGGETGLWGGTDLVLYLALSLTTWMTLGSFVNLSVPHLFLIWKTGIKIAPTSEDWHECERDVEIVTLLTGPGMSGERDRHSWWSSVHAWCSGSFKKEGNAVGWLVRNY